MARVEVDLPERFLFRTELPLRIGDINYGGHLGNDAVLSLVHEARVRFFREHGWSELAVEGTVGIILVDAAIVYRAEGTYGMTLAIDVAVTDVRSRGCDLLYRLAEAGTGKEIARAKTGVAFFDYTARKVASMPAAFRAVVAPGA